MYGLLVIAMFGGWSILHKQTAADTAVRMNQAFSDRLDKLWVIAQEALQDKKYLRAEKALLTILRVDERNATAYNRSKRNITMRLNALRLPRVWSQTPAACITLA